MAASEHQLLRIPPPFGYTFLLVRVNAWADLHRMVPCFSRRLTEIKKFKSQLSHQLNQMSSWKKYLSHAFGDLLDLSWIKHFLIDEAPFRWIKLWKGHLSTNRVKPISHVCWGQSWIVSRIVTYVFLWVMNWIKLVPGKNRWVMSWINSIPGKVTTVMIWIDLTLKR